MTCGVVYITFVRNTKADRIAELAHSVRSVKKMHPDLSVTLFTDENPNITGIDRVINIKVTGERLKQQYLYDSPYDSTLYLDADTMIVGSIMELFSLMDRFDIAACIDHMRKVNDTSKIWKSYADIPDGFSEFAGGVILFRKTESVKDFFDVWKNKYTEWCSVSGKYNDQPSFRVALYETANLSIHTLPPEYNIRSKKYHNIIPRIYHNHSLWKDDLQYVGGNIWM